MEMSYTYFVVAWCIFSILVDCTKENLAALILTLHRNLAKILLKVNLDKVIYPQNRFYKSSYRTYV
jgi:hypothetical protein